MMKTNQKVQKLKIKSDSRECLDVSSKMLPILFKTKNLEILFCEKFARSTLFLALETTFCVELIILSLSTNNLIATCFLETVRF